MKIAKIGLCALSFACVPAMAGHVTPSLGGWYADSNDVVGDLVSTNSSQRPSPKVSDRDLELPGIAPVGDPPPSLPIPPPEGPPSESGHDAHNDGSAIASQPADDNELELPNQNLVVIPLPGGAGLCAAGLGMLVSRRRR